MAPFLKGKGDFGPVIPALWLQGHLPSSPVPHISVKGRTSSARRAARLDEQKGLDLPDEQLITLIPFLLGASPSIVPHLRAARGWGNPLDTGQLYLWCTSCSLHRQLDPQHPAFQNFCRNYITLPFDLCFIFVHLSQSQILFPPWFPWDAGVSN